MDEKKRTFIQFVSLIAHNANWKGFFTGTIYKGSFKGVCVPGLNCHSCPGASGACPIGSVQSFLSGLRFQFPYYVLGLLIFFGAVLGRAVCGLLCPMGLIQDLLDRIPLKRKIHTFRFDRQFRYLKYAVLVLLVIVLPLCVKLTPFFCKYLCPSGTLAGILLSLGDSKLYSVIGSTFYMKLAILCALIMLSVIICRPFCRYLCPLGAFYSLFNRVSAVRMECDTDKCVKCGKCSSICGMAADPSKDPNSLECIRCGKCINVCPANALGYTAPFVKKKK